MTYRVVAVFDQNDPDPPRTHLVSPEAAEQGAPFFTLCTRRVVGYLLADPDVTQIPCPRCAAMPEARATVKTLGPWSSLRSVRWRESGSFRERPD